MLSLCLFISSWAERAYHKIMLHVLHVHKWLFLQKEKKISALESNRRGDRFHKKSLRFFNFSSTSSSFLSVFFLVFLQRFHHWHHYCTRIGSLCVVIRKYQQKCHLRNLQYKKCLRRELRHEGYLHNHMHEKNKKV